MDPEGGGAGTAPEEEGALDPYERMLGEVGVPRVLREAAHAVRQVTGARRATIYLVRGENKALKTLGANGAGKSTLFDAVCWGLFGKTTRGLTGPEVESWHEDANPTLVTVTVSVDGKEHTITRSRKPISLMLDGEPAEQKQSDLDNVRQIARDDPRMVANVVKNWVGAE